jgi:hypothetical protein
MKRRIVLNANEHGFGDAAVTAWIAEGSKGADVELVHYATNAKKAFLEMLGQTVVDTDSGAITTYKAYNDDELPEAGSIPRVYSRARSIGILAEPKRPSASIGKDAFDWADEIIMKRKKKGRERFVMLFPEVEWSSRQWPEDYWSWLAYDLEEWGVTTLTFLKKQDQRWTGCMPAWWAGATWEQLAALMMKVDLTVGNDSGPIHLSGTLDMPTLALCGATWTSVFAHMPSVTGLRAEHMPCVSCYWQPPIWKKRCTTRCRALYELTPETVRDWIMINLYGTRPTAFMSGMESSGSRTETFAEKSCGPTSTT